MTRHARRIAGSMLIAGTMTLAGIGCNDDTVSVPPPKSVNLPPETWLGVQGVLLPPHLYRIPLRWLGSDADGKVQAYRYRWTCVRLGTGQACPAIPPWTETADLGDTFTVYVPGDTAEYVFEVAAVDNDGVVDPTPASQRFHLYNTRPVVSFVTGTTPTSTLPAITYYLDAVDADSSADAGDADSRASIDQYRAWLDGHEDAAVYVPAAAGAVTFGPQDFQDRYGTRTVYVQALDDGGAVSAAQQHSWEVVAPPPNGILLVDDCRMGGFLEVRSDLSYRNVIAAAAPDRYVVLDIETVPRLSSPDLEATLSLFDRVVWYTDADTLSSGALELARRGLDALLGRSGHLFLSSGIAFGTHGAFGEEEPRFRDFFGIDSIFRGPNRSTNFALSQTDTVVAAVSPGLDRFHFLSLGLRAIMECFASRRDAATHSLYYYPEGTFVRGDSLDRFVNTTQFDIGVEHTLSGGAHTVYVSWPAGLPINDNVGENEIEIREMLRRAGILEP